jgi:hypothetical protein
MIRTLTFALLMGIGASLQAQFWTTGLGTDPAPATACGPFHLVISGNIPATNYSLTSAVVSVSGSTITADIEWTPSGIGLPVITPVTYNVPVGTTLSAGTYTVVVDYTAAGNMEISTWTIVVDSCSAAACDVDPTGLASMANADGSLDLSWGPVAGSVACRVRGRVLGTIPWATTAPSFGVEPTSFRIPGAFLNPGDTYEWQVQCACSISPLIATNWSASATFSAPLLREAVPEASGSSSVRFDGRILRFVQPEDQGSPFRIYDATGRVVLDGKVNTTVSLHDFAGILC